MNFSNFNNFPVVQFWSYFDHRYPFVKTDSGLSAYYHGNTDFPNVWEPNCTIPIGKGATAPLFVCVYMLISSEL